MPNKKFFLIVAGLLVIPFTNVAMADSDHHKESYSNQSMNPLYVNECGECHIPYPASFHTQDSWRKVLEGLENHFGDNAELNSADAASILQYLQSNARRSSFWDKDNSLRFTESHYFLKEHDEVPNGAVGKDKTVKTYADCKGCHQRADKGSFREREIKIPGFPHWDD